MIGESASNSPLLRLDGAQAAFGRLVFGPFTCGVEAGERIAILGPSGAGKSTLLKIIAREQALRCGRVLLDGRALGAWSFPELSRRRAVLPQSTEVAFGLQTELVIGLGRVARAHDPGLPRIVRDAAELACAAHLLDRRFDTLSGGEKARIQLARIFAQLWDAEGGLLLVDEPLAALDPGLQFDLLEHIETFAAARGHAVMAVLHDVNHALLGFDRLLLVREGAITDDLRSGAEALPALEALYGIAFDSATNRHGDLVVLPARRLAPGRMAA
ncbi:ABC transporter ATP-binding protein [Thauera sinica]|uniref:ABC transporter ATP-binding protein n=1 Tax=Thauera sinica TaxID=2665146 RepID=A0ABW1ATQ0_9RHOO|nr:ATP-binding cassette domain-containing protein [Thauera sp. K11]ATE61903.1 ABC transporter [Thauera sp. K11]